MKKNWACSLLTFFLLMFSGSGHAALTTIGTATYNGSGYNLIWDDNNNGNSVVWLDYKNRAENWTDQNNWAAGLDSDSNWTFNLESGVSVDWGNSSWRLPTTAGGEGYDKTNSEMGHLYYTELGNSSGQSGLTTGDFENLGTLYWSGTEYAGDSDDAWRFNMSNGYQDRAGKHISYYGLAVRSGQVSAVPVPGAFWLLGSGLLGLIGIARKRHVVGN